MTPPATSLARARGGKKRPPNRRNGRSKKTVQGNLGEITIATPRDRDGTFEPQLIGKHQRRIPGSDEKIMALYAKGTPRPAATNWAALGTGFLLLAHRCATECTLLGSWAPDVKEYRGKFYMTYSAMPKKVVPPRLLIALAVSDKPEGPYKDLYAPWFDFGYSAIDGHIFVDDDGRPYLYFSRNGVQDGYSFGIIYGVALAHDLSKPVGEAVKLMAADQPWEKVRYAENRCNEGAFVLKHNGRYYMTYSANHTGFPHYGIGFAIACDPLGPWAKAEENPIAATNLEIGVSGPGHSCITRSPDGKEMFIVYHTHADPQRPSGERVVNIDRLQFDEDGTLKIKGPTRSPQPMPSRCQ